MWDIIKIDCTQIALVIQPYTVKKTVFNFTSAVTFNCGDACK